MNIHQNDDLQAFLIEADLVNQKVKALAENKITIQELDILQKKKNDQIAKKQQKKRIKEEELKQIKINGRQGKGITKDFASFCRSCHQEYQLQTIKCLKCGKSTMTLQQRQKQLEQMVNEYKYKKAKKQARRQKWDMWKKTQSMLPSKLATQYTKWQAYTSSEEQAENEQPIVPKDDPNFKALEMDLQQRKKRKYESDKKSNAYKEKGNKLMADKKYQQAADCYSLALEQARDNKLLYTNRALAYIKLKRWQRAIKDCTTVIQYMECFEKLEECLDLAFKAFSRRALAHKERKQYSKALQDVETALKYNSKDQSALRLKQQIQNFIKFQKQSSQILKQNLQNKQTKQQQQQKQFSEKDIVKELAELELNKQLNSDTKEQKQQKLNQPQQPVEKLKYYLENISSGAIEKLLKLLISQPNLKSVFIKLEGITKLLFYIQKQEDKGKSIVLLSYLMDGNGIAQQQVWNFNPHKFQQKCIEILNSQLKTDSYSQLEDYFEIFVALSLNQKYRLLLAQSQQTINFVKQCYPILITKYKKQPQVLNAYIIYFSNLCKGETKIKLSVSSNIKPILESVHRILITQTKNPKIHQLQKSLYILLSNLATNSIIKSQILSNNQILQTASTHLKTFPKSNQLFEPLIEAALSVFVNILFQTNQDTLQVISKYNLENVLFDRFIASQKANQFFIRAIHVFSKLDFKNKEVHQKWITKTQGFFDQDNIQKGITNHALRFYNNIYLSHKQLDLPTTTGPIFELLNSSNQILFCNSCNLFGIWADNPRTSAKTYSSLRKYIEKLINIAKQKTGNIRKSSAILLAKISRDEQSKEIFIAHHGMDVIKSIANFVLDKK